MSQAPVSVRAPRPARAALAAGFVALVAAPLALALARGAPPSAALAERRLPAPRARTPRSLAEALAWPRRFDAWYGDHFWLRTQLLATHNRVVWSALAQSPSELEVRGREGWLFTTANRGLDVARGAYPLLPSRLDGWVRTLRERERALAARNVAYLFALAPNKEQIYPEFLQPPWNERGATRVDQLLEALGPGRPSMLVDLRAALLAEKEHDGERGPGDLTYYRLGGHWTDRGAFAAHQALAARLGELGVRLRPLARADFDVSAIGEGDSAAPSMYLDGLLRQQALRWLARERAGLGYDEATIDEEREWVHARPDAQADSLVVFNDSFGPHLRRFWASSASAVGSYWSSFELALIDERAPRAVVELYVDRVLAHTLPAPFELRAASESRAAFDALENVLWRAAPFRRGTHARPATGTQAQDTDEGVRLVNPRGQCVLELELGELRASAPCVLLEFSAPRDGRVDVLYQTRRERRFERYNTVSSAFAAGRSQVALALCDDEVVGPWQVRFTPLKDEACTLHALEVRAK